MENQEIDVIYHKGYQIKTYIDDCPESPRQWDDFGKILTFKNIQKKDILYLII